VFSLRNEEEDAVLCGSGAAGAGWGVAAEVAVVLDAAAAESFALFAGLAASSANAAVMMKNPRTATETTRTIDRIISS
jgi:hypothetical protein